MTVGDHALLQILPESREDSFYMMQTIKIGSCEATIFFDPGANVNLIKQTMEAERDAAEACRQLMEGQACLLYTSDAADE